MVSAWELAWSCANPLEFISTGSSCPRKALPPLAPAACSAMPLCHKLQSSGVQLEGNWEQWSERGHAFPRDALSHPA